MPLASKNVIHMTFDFEYRCGTKENLDTVVVKIDERWKLCLTTQKFIYYYLKVAAMRKKESLEIETTSSTRQRSNILWWEKKRADTELEFFPWFSIVFLTFLSTGFCLVYTPPERTLHQNGARKFSPPYVFTSVWTTTAKKKKKKKKTRIVPSLPAVVSKAET